MKKILVCSILLLIAFGGQSQNNKHKKNYLCIDAEGKTIFQTVLKFATTFENGLAQVRKYTIVGNKAYIDRGYMDENANIVIPCVYTRASDFRDGVAVVQKRGSKKYYIINKQGQRLGNIEFDQMTYIFGGLAKVKVNDKMGYINLKGEWQIPAKYANASPFYDDLTFVANEQSKWAIINKSGKILSGFIYPGPLSFQGGYARVQVNGKWGIMDKNLKMVIPAQYEGIESYGDGLFAYKQYGKWGYLDETGKVVVKAQYEDVNTFENGFGLITQNAKKGLINTKGEMVLEPKYRDIWTQYAGYHNLLVTFMGDKPVFLDTSGNAFTKVNADFMRGSLDGSGPIMYRDTNTKKFGYLNNKGEVIVEAKYCKANPFSEGKALVQLCD